MLPALAWNVFPLLARELLGVDLVRVIDGSWLDDLDGRLDAQFRSRRS